MFSLARLVADVLYVFDILLKRVHCDAARRKAGRTIPTYDFRGGPIPIR